MKLSRLALVALLGASIAVPSIAQPGPGGGMGGGMGGGYRFNQNNTPGWTLMTEQERAEFQQQMRDVKTYDECKSVQAGHRKLMEERAKEKNVTLRTPRVNPCDRMKSRGMIQ